MPTRRHVLGWLAAGLGGAATAGRAQGARLKTVATFSIIADFVRNVGGDRVDLVTLVGPNGDAHVYSPSPADARRVTDADLLFANGLAFEGWITRLLKSSGSRARLVETAQGARTIAISGAAAHSGAGHRHAREADPHAWQDIGNARTYVANIRDALAGADPAGQDPYQGNAARYLSELAALDAEAKASIGAIPPERRKVIVAHDALAYFGRAYGLEFIAPQGVSTEAEASAGDIARIIQQIRREKIAAVFLENVSDARLVERIARETGARIGGRLYSDALSAADGPAGTYIAMMRHNIRTITAALAP